MNTITAITNQGDFHYPIDNTGNTDISFALQQIFDELSQIENISATLDFAPGCYFVDSPILIKIPSIALRGNGHGGIDIHGQNQLSGTTFRFGKNCGPDCITFEPTGRNVAFPSGETPWPYGTTKFSFSHINFVGYNNTDVDTANGYSRFRGDSPNFRELKWYPAKGRYENPETQGQRAIVIKSNKGGKPEMVDLEYCYFTDLFTGLDILTSDVSTIHHCWFAQMVNGIIYHEAGQVMTLHDNCFADLETAVQLGNPIASTLHDNGFAYVSKCFVIENAHETNIHHNVVKNWDQAKGTASCSGFLYLGGTNKNVMINGNIINNELESHVKTRTIDEQPNGRAFIQIENCNNVIFSENIIDTRQKEEPVKFINCKRVIENNNLI